MAIRRNQTWVLNLTIVIPDTGAPMVLTGIPLRMQIRPSPDSPVIYADMTTGNGKIDATTQGGSGTMILSLTATDTAAIPAGSHHFDIIRTDSLVPLVVGRAIVEQGVTR